MAPSPLSGGPLSGIRVVELTTAWAGPLSGARPSTLTP